MVLPHLIFGFHENADIIWSENIQDRLFGLLNDKGERVVRQGPRSGLSEEAEDERVSIRKLGGSGGMLPRRKFRRSVQNSSVKGQVGCVCYLVQKSLNVEGSLQKKKTKNISKSILTTDNDNNNNMI